MTFHVGGQEVISGQNVELVKRHADSSTSNARSSEVLLVFEISSNT
jgi:hypothetical protein